LNPPAFKLGMKPEPFTDADFKRLNEERLEDEEL